MSYLIHVRYYNVYYLKDTMKINGTYLPTQFCLPAVTKLPLGNTSCTLFSNKQPVNVNLKYLYSPSFSELANVYVHKLSMA